MNPTFQPETNQVSFRERINQCTNRPSSRYFLSALSLSFSVGAGSFLLCTAKESIVPPTNQCIMAEMPKFFAYASSGLGIVAVGSYVLTNLCKLRNRIQQGTRVEQDPHGDNASNSGGNGPRPNIVANTVYLAMQNLASRQV